MLDNIQDIFTRITGITDYSITPQTKLKQKDIPLSSFTLIQLFCELEDAFDIEIPNAAIKKMKTVGDIMNYIRQHTM